MGRYLSAALADIHVLLTQPFQQAEPAGNDETEMRKPIRTYECGAQENAFRDLGARWQQHRGEDTEREYRGPNEQELSVHMPIDRDDLGWFHKGCLIPTSTWHIVGINSLLFGLR